MAPNVYSSSVNYPETDTETAKVEDMAAYVGGAEHPFIQRGIMSAPASLSLAPISTFPFYLLV